MAFNCTDHVRAKGEDRFVTMRKKGGYEVARSKNFAAYKQAGRGAGKT